MTIPATATTVSTPTAKTTERLPFRLEARHAIGGFVVFFLIVFAMNAFMIWRAVSTFGGLETADAYRKGVAYNTTVAAARVQDARGWTDTVRFDGNRLVAGIVDREGRPVDGLQITGTVGRPATNEFDRRLLLTADGRGAYAANAGELGAGSWIASLEARDGADIVHKIKVRLWKAP
jgi:nitrogen fixation protein FixH